jgi:hypothetical protein
LKNIILLLFIAAGYSAKSQIIVNGVNLEIIKPHYISISLIAGKMLDNKVEAIINYGQPINNFRDEVLEKPDGSAMEFNSEIDMLNYLANNKYAFEHTYFRSNTDGNRTIFLLKLSQ